MAVIDVPCGSLPHCFKLKCVSYNDRATARLPFIRDIQSRLLLRRGSSRETAGCVSSSLVLLLVVGVLKKVASDLLRHPALLGGKGGGHGGHPPVLGTHADKHDSLFETA